MIGLSGKCRQIKKNKKKWYCDWTVWLIQRRGGQREGQIADLPLGADKTRHASNGVFSVVSNDKNKNYDTIQSAWEFS